jgi:hypothetical protein
MDRYPDGMLVLVRNGIGRIHKSGNLKPGCFGYWVIDRTGDSGQDWGFPAFTQHVTPAVVGATVCVNPRFPTCKCMCWCGLTHVSREEMAWLPRVGA